MQKGKVSEVDERVEMQEDKEIKVLLAIEEDLDRRMTRKPFMYSISAPVPEN